MDLQLSETQRELDALVRRFAAERCGVGEADEWRQRWQGLADLGVLGLELDEVLGGAGCGLAETAILFTGLATVVCAIPLMSTVGLSLPILRAARDATVLGDVAAGRVTYAVAGSEPGERLWDWAPTAVSARVAADGTVLTGTKTWVVEAMWADWFLVPARHADGVGIFAVRNADAAIVAERVWDPSRPLATVIFEQAPAELVLAPPTVGAVEAELRVRRRVLAAAECVGLISAALDAACVHAKQREQFGRAIGSFQAVSHRLVDVFADRELSTSLVRWAAAAADDRAADADLAAAASLAFSRPAAVRAAEAEIQTMGGLGMTWEIPAHRHLKRALGYAALDVGVDALHLEVATALA